MRQYLSFAILFWGVFANAGSTNPALNELVANRQQIATGFAESAANCVQRQDTAHVAFHGCIDWHSAVHGTWALVAYTATTGDQRYVPLIRSVTASAKINEEQQLLAANPDFEMPYGRAWLLRLGLEYENQFHDGHLQSIADFAADSIAAYYRRNPPDPMAREYKSAAWALINVFDYYASRHDEKKLDEVRQLIRKSFVEHRPSCDAATDRAGFMAICTNWAWLVSRVMTREEYLPWVDRFLPISRLPKPVRDPRDAHEYGLNFSRAWGLLGIYRVTWRPEYLTAYAEHVEATLSNRGNWAVPYEVVGHWVPQFGMFAIEPLFDAAVIAPGGASIGPANGA
ncbi:DUF2891 family protein [Andreprevotia chitinilytica]|uniref:DUF2891 family protein n=1 Tax=Andreprevotia chitinilytica TaxID=396808 RepID=UPI00054E656A|nr:DUF2891 family protein [Andreprevotia chitinilytica]